MSLAVKEILVFSINILFLLTYQENTLRLALLTGFALSCWGQYGISQDSLKSLGWQFRNEKNSGLVVGGMLIPVTLLSTARTTSTASLHYDYHIASLLLMGVMVVVMKLCSSFSSPSKKFERRIFLTFVLVVLLYFFINLWNWIYIASLFLGFIYFVGIVYFLPCSFTIGEAMLVSQALTLFMLDGCCHVLLSLPANPLYACLQVLINGVILICLCFCMVMMILKDNGYSEKSEKDIKKSEIYSHQFRRTCVFYAVTFLVTVFVLFPLLSYMLGEFVIIWGLEFVFKTNVRIVLIVSWLVMIFVASLVVYMTESSSTIVRKYFHLIAVAIFVPGIVLDLGIVYLASAGAFFIFIIMELIRVCRILPFGSILHEAFSVFVDERDSGIVILTHIYLLLGFSIPVWLYQHVEPSQGLILFSGVISLGIGDTAASVIGYKYGKHRWSAETVKTVEGTLAAIVSQLVACYILGNMALESSYSWIAIAITVLLTSLLEAFTSQIDNIILPVFMSSMFCVLDGIL